MDRLLYVYGEGSLGNLRQGLSHPLVIDVLVADVQVGDEVFEDIQGHLDFSFGKQCKNKGESILAQSVQAFTPSERLLTLLESLTSHVDKLQLLVFICRNVLIDTCCYESHLFSTLIGRSNVQEVLQGVVFEAIELLNPLELLLFQVDIVLLDFHLLLLGLQELWFLLLLLDDLDLLLLLVI